jgi:hypothetical protein
MAEKFRISLQGVVSKGAPFGGTLGALQPCISKLAFIQVADSESQSRDCFVLIDFKKDLSRGLLTVCRLVNKPSCAYQSPMFDESLQW